MTETSNPIEAALAAWRNGEHASALNQLETALRAGSAPAAQLALQLYRQPGAPDGVEARIRDALDAAPSTPPIERHRAFLRAAGIGSSADPAEAIAARIKTALDGDSDAMTELGLLSELAGDSEAADALYAVAAAGGSGHAVAARMRRMARAGAVEAGTVQQGMALAQAGHPLAASLLQMIQPLEASLPTPPDPDFDALDPERLAAAPAHIPVAAEKLYDTPRVERFAAAVPETLCDYLAAGAAPLLRPAEVFDPTSGEHRPDPYRQSLTAALPDAAMDLALWGLKTRMAAAAGARFDQGEYLAMLVYRPGDHYRPHFDYITEDDGPASADLAARGQRTATSLVKLNDEYSGGATHFSRLDDLRWHGPRGDMLSFDNVDADGQGDPRTLHAGEAVTEGMKLLASLWLRERA